VLTPAIHSTSATSFSAHNLAATDDPAPAYLLRRLAWPCRHCLRSYDQIFVIHTFSAIVHFYRPIFPLTNQRFGFRGPIALFCGWSCKKCPRYGTTQSLLIDRSVSNRKISRSFAALGART